MENNNEVLEAEVLTGDILNDAQVEVDSIQSAQQLRNIAAQTGCQSSMNVDQTGKIVVTVHNASDEQLNKISRKANIKAWSNGIVSVMDTVSHFCVDVGDFAVNGAMVPAVQSTVKAGAEVAKVGIEAVAVVGASTIASVGKAGIALYDSLSNNEALADCKNTWSQIGTNLKNKLLGVSGTGNFKRLTGN